MKCGSLNNPLWNEKLKSYTVDERLMEIQCNHLQGNTIRFENEEQSIVLSELYAYKSTGIKYMAIIDSEGIREIDREKVIDI